MKKRLTIIVSVILVIFVVVVGVSFLQKRAKKRVDDIINNANPTKESTTTSTTSTTTTTKQTCNHNLVDTVYKEAKPGLNGIIHSACTKCDFFELKEIPPLPDAFELTIVDKYTHQDEQYKYILFDVQIKNVSDKTISMIEGNLTVIGTHLVVILCEFNDLSIAPGETVTLTGYNVKFDPEDSKNTYFSGVYDTPFEEMTFEFELSDIICE